MEIDFEIIAWKVFIYLIKFRTDNTIKNHFYSTLRRALRRINKILGNKNSTNKKFYARCYYKTLDGKEIGISLHKFINNTPVGRQTDHINRDGLDNRKSNLRTCSIAENKQNQDAQKNNKSSGIKNIYWCKKQQKWRVALRINQVLKSFGRYEYLEEAIKVADDARKKYFVFAN